MKLNKQIIISLAALLCITVFTSCKKAKYYQISEEDETEWAIYQLNQSFKFISTQGDLRTYAVGGRFRAYFRDGSVYNEYLYTTIGLQGDTNYVPQDGYRGVFLDRTSDGLSVKVGLPHYSENSRIDDQTPTMQVINGKTYTDVYVVAADPFKVDSIQYIDTLFYSKAYGFLKYIDKYGETYVRTQ